METLQKKIEDRLSALTGDVCFYYEEFGTGESLAFNADQPVIAASVIKLAVLTEAFRQMETGLARADEIFTVHRDDKLPSCGALTYLHDGICVTFLDLCVLMIILSDNTATNLLIRRLGIARINETLRALGLRKTTLRRLLFDSAASARGVENHITARETGQLLRLMYEGKAVSPGADSRMLSILSDQRLNGKIPFFLPRGVRAAHKTGEDSGITHDVGIIYAKRPFVVCFCSQKTDVPAMERAMQDITLLLYENAQRP
ncbi:MAG: serine hydrolase [Subdoligranulum sp.]|nr:serine hydrolase [Subdoligranulum sp.]